LTGRYYKKIQNKMYEDGEMPSSGKTAGVEIYRWSDEGQTLYYIPVEGDTAAYCFSSYPDPAWKAEYQGKDLSS
jgi:hypothetical protein